MPMPNSQIEAQQQEGSDLPELGQPSAADVLGIDEDEAPAEEMVGSSLAGPTAGRREPNNEATYIND